MDYLDEHGHRIFEGDIMVSGHSAATGLDKSNVSTSATPWTFGIVPFTIDRAVPESARDALAKAIEEFEDRTNIRFVVRRGANESLYPSYLKVVPAVSETFAGRSAVGMQGGEQLLELTSVANVHTALHELGHAIGLLHEQQRHDRDQYVTIHEENVVPENRDWYRNIDPDGADVGDYDFASVMHYSLYNAQGQVEIDPRSKLDLQTSCSIGTGTQLSRGDVAAITLLYPDPNLGKHGDLDGDGIRDHVARGQEGVYIRRSFGGVDDGGPWKEVSPGGTLDWYLTGTGDFGGDGIDDLLWTTPDGSLRVLDMGKGALDAAGFVNAIHTPKNGWQVVSIDDFDGDGRDELLTVNGWGALALVFPASYQEIAHRPVFGWRGTTTGDLNGDAKADIVWSHAQGQAVVWYMNGATVVAETEPTSHDPAWWIAGIDDFDGDRRNDIVWTSVQSGVAMWWNDGGPIGNLTMLQQRSPTDVALAGTGDFDGDGIADLRWTNGNGWYSLEHFSTSRDVSSHMVGTLETILLIENGLLRYGGHLLN